VFARVKDYVERFDHDKLVAASINQGIQAAIDPDTGEIDPRVAAEAAARTMQSLYLSDSTKAKVGVIDRLGLDRRQVRTKEFKSWKVDVISVEPGYEG
jgi:hypothetical protein